MRLGDILAPCCLAVCKTKEAQQRKVVDSRHSRLRICRLVQQIYSFIQQDRWPCPVGFEYPSLLQMAGQTQLTVTGFGEVQYANKVLPRGAMSESRASGSSWLRRTIGTSGRKNAVEREVRNSRYRTGPMVVVVINKTARANCMACWPFRRHPNDSCI